MTDRAQAVLQEALTLPIDDRADVAAELLASLDEDTEDIAAVQRAWAMEIESEAVACWLANPMANRGKTCAARSNSVLGSGESSVSR
jgi:hypothetical protein